MTPALVPTPRDADPVPAVPISVHHSRSRRFALAPLIKTLTVEMLCRVPFWRQQNQLAKILRWLWPGFRDA